MTVSRDEALLALASVTEADNHIRTWQGYREAAPHLIVWGLIWMAGNATADFMRAWAGAVWIVSGGIGTLLTVVLTVRQARQWQGRHPDAVAEGRAIGRRASMLGTTLMLWFPTLLLIAGPLAPRQTNALLSVTWAFIYMITGAFKGARLFAIGLFTAAAVLVGYLFVEQHYFLWMAVFGGGSLIAGGFWLKRH